MKLYIAGLLAGCFLWPAIVAQVTNLPPVSGKHQTHTTDHNLRDRLVGAWYLSVTNPIRGEVSGQWMRTETAYRRDGTFEVKGKIGTLVPVRASEKTFVKRDGKWVPWVSSTRSAEGGGIWRIDQGVLYSTFTHGNWQTNVENHWEIVSLTDTEFMYRLETGNTKGPLLKAIRRR